MQGNTHTMHDADPLRSVLGAKEFFCVRSSDKVSTREDRCEQQVCISVEAYLLFNRENDPLAFACRPSLGIFL